LDLGDPKIAMRCVLSEEWTVLITSSLRWILITAAAAALFGFSRIWCEWLAAQHSAWSPIKDLAAGSRGQQVGWDEMGGESSQQQQQQQ
jgi:hypothetical protein